MFIIIEIILTIFAWRNGWKWLSLLPMGISFLIGILIGIFIDVAGGEITTEVTSFAIIFDILAIIALILMNTNKPNNYKSQELEK